MRGGQAAPTCLQANHRVLEFSMPPAAAAAAAASWIGLEGQWCYDKYLQPQVRMPAVVAQCNRASRGYGRKSRVQWMNTISVHCCADLKARGPRSGCPG